MESDEMQAVDKAEIVNQYRNLLTDFWKVDSRFSAQTLATEEKKKSETNSAQNEYDNTDRSLLQGKNSDLDGIHTEESSNRNSAEEKRNQISESAKTAKDALNEIAFSHFVSLSDDRNTQIESDIDLVRALDGLVSKAHRSANNIKNEIEDYKKWKERHSNMIYASIFLGVSFVFISTILGIKEFDIYKIYKMGKELYQQQIYLGAIEKFESLQTQNSLFKGNAYYQEIRSLLDTCYYNSTKTAIEKGEWEKAFMFLSKLSQNTTLYLDIRYEINYQRGVQAMKKKDWFNAVYFFTSIDKNYKSTAKFLQECNWRLKGGRAPTTQPEMITSTENKQAFRSKPAMLSYPQVKAMLKDNDFFCTDYSWNEEFSNPQGRGFANKFEKSPDGKVIYDRASGLTWQQSGSDNSMFDADEVEKYARGLNAKNFAGHNDWRLPTLEEAMSLIEREKNNAGLYINPMFDKTQSRIWTVDEHSAGVAWVAVFYSGSCGLRHVADLTFVRVVR